MSSKNLIRRLERLEARLTPSSDDGRVLKITLTRIGEPDEVFELRGIKPNDRRRPRWQNGGRER